MPETSVARTYSGVPAIGDFYTRLLGDVDRIVADAFSTGSIPKSISIHLLGNAAEHFFQSTGHANQFAEAGLGKPQKVGKGIKEKRYRVKRYKLSRDKKRGSVSLTFHLGKV